MNFKLKRTPFSIICVDPPKSNHVSAPKDIRIIDPHSVEPFSEINPFQVAQKTLDYISSEILRHTFILQYKLTSDFVYALVLLTVHLCEHLTKRAVKHQIRPALPYSY